MDEQTPPTQLTTREFKALDPNDRLHAIRKGRCALIANQFGLEPWELEKLVETRRFKTNIQRKARREGKTK